MCFRRLCFERSNPRSGPFAYDEKGIDTRWLIKE
jgi:hypothetical protein